MEDTLLMNFGIDMESFFIDLNKYGKNFIYIDDNYSKRDLNLIFSGFNNKIWHPSVYKYIKEHYKKPIRKLQSPDVPLITIYNFGGTEYLEILMQLLNLFRNDGYNPAIATDSSMGIAAGFEFVPIEENNEIHCLRAPEMLKDIYDPDIILYSINSQSKDIDFLRNIEKNLEADIKIVVTDKYSSVPEEFINNNDNIVILMSDDDYFKGENKNMKVFNYFKNNKIKELYKYVINLFENDNLSSP